MPINIYIGLRKNKKNQFFECFHIFGERLHEEWQKYVFVSNFQSKSEWSIFLCIYRVRLLINSLYLGDPLPIINFKPWEE